MKQQEQWFVYIFNGTENHFWQMSVEPTRWYAEEVLQHWLDIHFPNQWEYTSQYTFKDGLAGDFVAGMVSSSNYHVEMRNMRERWEKDKLERTQYGVYGKAGHDSIIAEARILLTIVERDERLLEWGGLDLSPSQQRRFIKLGGSNGHTGNSWACVCEAAYNLSQGREPFATGLPELNRTVITIPILAL